MEKETKKKSKFVKCKKCGRTTIMMICECGNPVYKQTNENNKK